MAEIVFALIWVVRSTLLVIDSSWSINSSSDTAMEWKIKLLFSVTYAVTEELPNSPVLNPKRLIDSSDIFIGSGCIICGRIFLLLSSPYVTLYLSEKGITHPLLVAAT